jgi:glucose/arabinose dehydrogenase
MDPIVVVLPLTGRPREERGTHMRHFCAAWIPTVGLLSVLLAQPQPALAQLATGEPTSLFDLEDSWLPVNNATDIAFLSDGRAVVVRKQGVVIVTMADGTVQAPMAATMQVDNTNDEKGLLGVVVDEQDNLYFYASTGADSLNKHKVYKGRAAANGMVTIDANPILSMGLEGPANHDGGGLVVHEGHLYVAVGDTGANATPPQNRYGACLNKANGKILRIKLDGTTPGDNPLSGMAMVTGCAARTTGDFALMAPDTRIWAWGFRNPWRFWIDPETDLMWIGDVGETTQEEVTVGGKGTHHGWPFVEGTMQYAGLGGLTGCSQMTPSTPCTPPQDSYLHTPMPGAQRQQSSVTGGLIPPKGCGWGAYEGRYFFGDYNRRNIWTLDVKPDRSGAVAGSRKDFATISSPVSFRAGRDGSMYIVSHAEGIKRLKPKALNCQAAPPPPDGGTDGSGGGAGGAGGTGGGSSADGGDVGGRGGDSASGGAGSTEGGLLLQPGRWPPHASRGRAGARRAGSPGHPVAPATASLTAGGESCPRGVADR